MPERDEIIAQVMNTLHSKDYFNNEDSIFRRKSSQLRKSGSQDDVEYFKSTSRLK